MKKHSEGYDRLFKGSVIYLIGSFFSKSLIFIIIPILTFTLTTSELGEFDVFLTLSTIAIPLFTLQIIEACFRFLFDANKVKKSRLISTLFFFLSVGMVIFFIVVLSIHILFFNINNVIYILIYYFMNLILISYQRISRALGHSKIFALSGILFTILVVIFQTIALLVLKMKIDGLFISYISATVLVITYMEYKLSLRKYIHIKKINFTDLRNMIKFGLPLVPNNISWLAVSTINRLLIVTMLSYSANGVFSVAFRFTAIIVALSEVFKLSWQESAIITNSSKEKASFNSEVLNHYISFLVILGATSLPFIKFFIVYLIEESYSSAWQYIPIITIGACFSAVVSFYGAGYIASKKTSGALWTTLSGAIISLLFTYLLIDYLGLFAPSIGTTMGYLSIWVIRHFSMKKIFPVKIYVKKNIYIFLVYFSSVTIYYLMSNFINLIWGLILATIYMITNMNLILSIFQKFKKTYFKNK